ncbi:MAG TPA: sodium:dicarboxylate symporter [Methylophaga sp.]|jgi:Na+/H+-dicarboxylate symporter|uniref:dicarboxylate/amino acid:cation symporter n=1 Tax=unclassified Methylophaga TaxID=2629249 RepID=UPI000C981665|nr:MULTISPECIES: dicarboxylate/amino acid:cation symporter [unclassified Methylophaga]MAP25895.1 sodium:dicarboxylate symporter [Methylophaga sp.]HAD31275.1 sodium:dicarboxylate symporter [Methylophaga sp.]HCO01644.1 sodium:dicarboxylate symporter [Methylophaga sp.]|tara:strand:+ start:126 stop:1343 length:1218 start_codon:yes stop_codon:yes gene_type:complete
MPHSHAVILLILIILSAISGVLFGWFFGDLSLQIGWLGDLFLNALKMIIIPLIVASVISGIGALGDVRKLGRLGGSTLLYYGFTTAVAVFIGLVVVNIIQPGAGIELGDATVPERILEKQGTGASDIIMSLISPNLFASATEMQLLPIIVFAILFAMALTTIGERSKPVFSVFDGINEAMMKLVIWIMYFAPIGIFALIAARIGLAGGGEELFKEIEAVGWHVVTVLTGLFIHFCFLFLLLQLVAGKGLAYLFGMSRALFTGFGTASSTATLPLTMENARENNVSDKAIKFVLPLGSTVNMDGTALYEAAAVLFIAQAYGIDLTMTQQIIVFITATLAAIGAAGIPEAGLVTMVIVLSAVGLPLDGIALLLAVDWFLDRFRTVVNIWGDSVGAKVIDTLVIKKAL